MTTMQWLGRFGRASAVILAIACLSSASAWAEDKFPTRTIRILVGFAPGGGADLMARAISSRLTEQLGQPVIVENRPGANGSVAAEAAATSPADGYTLYLMTVSQAIGQSLYTTLRYNIEKDFVPLAHVGRVSQIVVANPSTTIKTMGDFVAQAKARRGGIRYTTSGNGSGEHIAGAMLEQMAGIELGHVPYKTGADAVAAVVGGHVETGVTTLVAANNFVRSGQLRALAVTASERSRLYADVPTISEATGIRGYEMYTWYGLLAPAGTPRPVVTLLNAEINKALRHPDTLKVLDRVAVDPTGGSVEQFAALLKAEVAKYAQVIKAANVKID